MYFPFTCVLNLLCFCISPVLPFILPFPSCFLGLICLTSLCCYLQLLNIAIHSLTFLFHRYCFAIYIYTYMYYIFLSFLLSMSFVSPVCVVIIGRLFLMLSVSLCLFVLIIYTYIYIHVFIHSVRPYQCNRLSLCGTAANQQSS